MQSKKILMYALGISLCVNIVSGYFIAKQGPIVQSVLGIETSELKYPLLAKQVLRELPQDRLINFLSLRRLLTVQTEPFGESFGLYFEYLPTGTSIGINSSEDIYAASLIKVPLVMAYYHMRERTQLQGDPMLEIRKEHIDTQFGELWKKGVGYKLKASEAVKLALTESDNTAVNILVPLITDEDFDQVYESLGLDFQKDPNGAIVSAKNYAAVLKALYFSSVLSKEDSQAILDMLTKTKFPDKLAAGVPQEVPIAHKIGDFVGDKGDIGFRDCGIVYVPRRPYVLCMYSTSNEQTARERMQGVSTTVYNYVIANTQTPLASPISNIEEW